MSETLLRALMGDGPARFLDQAGALPGFLNNGIISSPAINAHTAEPPHARCMMARLVVCSAGQICQASGRGHGLIPAAMGILNTNRISKLFGVMRASAAVTFVGLFLNTSRRALVPLRWRDNAAGFQRPVKACQHTTASEESLAVINLCQPRPPITWRSHVAHNSSPGAIALLVCFRICSSKLFRSRADAGRSTSFEIHGPVWWRGQYHRHRCRHRRQCIHNWYGELCSPRDARGVSDRLQARYVWFSVSQRSTADLSLPRCFCQQVEPGRDRIGLLDLSRRLE